MGEIGVAVSGILRKTAQSVDLVHIVLEVTDHVIQKAFFDRNVAVTTGLFIQKPTEHGRNNIVERICGNRFCNFVLILCVQSPKRGLKSVLQIGATAQNGIFGSDPCPHLIKKRREWVGW